MLPFKLVYHDGYDLNLGSHVFPSRKYRMIRDRLLGDGFVDSDGGENGLLRGGDVSWWRDMGVISVIAVVTERG